MFYRTIMITLIGVAISQSVLATTNQLSTNRISSKTNQQSEANQLSTQQQKESRETSLSASRIQAGALSHEMKININKASEKEFIRVRGLNASKAKALVQYRKKHGDFKDLDTLAKVRGFKRMKPDDLDNIKNQLTIN